MQEKKDFAGRSSGSGIHLDSAAPLGNDNRAKALRYFGGAVGAPTIDNQQFAIMVGALAYEVAEMLFKHSIFVQNWHDD